MSDDVVAELDGWIAAVPPGKHATVTLQRARDEIVALRAFKARVFADVRDAALEEAAHECDEEAKGSGGEVAFRDGCETCAAAIRLLKEARK